jgi:leader peptidase (prepilin peptidase) / N-methyltransferase
VTFNVNDVAWRARCRGSMTLMAVGVLPIGLAALGVAAWAAMADSDVGRLWADCLLGWGLLALAWTDWRSMRLPDVLTLPLIVLGLAATALTSPASLPASVMGAILGYAAFNAIAASYHLLRGHQGLGGGDAKLLAAAGAWLGWEALPDVVTIAAFLGIAGLALLRLFERPIGDTTTVAFGPYLAVAIWIVRLQGPLFFVAAS